jgi:hypothetical protein
LYHYTGMAQFASIVLDNQIIGGENYLGPEESHTRPHVVWLLDDVDINAYGFGLHKFQRSSDGFLPPDRTAVRIEVQTDRAIRWLDWLPVQTMLPEWRESIIRVAGGPEAVEHWWLVTGDISMKEIRGVSFDDDALVREDAPVWVRKAVHQAAREIERMSAAATSTEHTLGMQDLAGYNKDVARLVIRLVEERGLTWKLSKNTLLLFPTDDTAPFKVWARNTQHVATLVKWAERHAPAAADTPATTESIEALAAIVNGPEHPAPEDTTMSAAPADEDTRPVIEITPDPDPEPQPADITRPPGKREWQAHEHVGDARPYRMTNGELHPQIMEFSSPWGEWFYWCKDCQEFIAGFKSIGAHTRWRHSPKPTPPLIELPSGDVADVAAEQVATIVKDAIRQALADSDGLAAQNAALREQVEQLKARVELISEALRA